MEPETEQLFRKWLKIQIWQHWLQIINRVVVIIVIVVSLWFSIVYVFPSLMKQLENLQTMMGQLNSASQGVQKQQDFLKNLQDQLPIIK